MLRVEVSAGGRCRFSAAVRSAEGSSDAFRASGPVFTATPWRWVGALLGLFAAAPGSAPVPATPVEEGFAGTAAFHDFRITA